MTDMLLRVTAHGVKRERAVPEGWSRSARLLSGPVTVRTTLTALKLRWVAAFGPLADLYWRESPGPQCNRGGSPKTLYDSGDTNPLFAWEDGRAVRRCSLR